MKPGINLLPFDYRRRTLLRGLLLRWAIAWIVCATAAGVVLWLEQTWHQRSADRLEAAEFAYRPLAKLLRQSDASRGELRKLHAKGTILGQLSEERPALVLIGAASESAKKCDGRLVVRDLLFQRCDRAKQNRPHRKQSRKAKTEAPTPRARPWATVTFKGDAMDNLAIATFAASLRDSGLFRRVELKSSVGKNDADAAVRAFTVECEI